MSIINKYKTEMENDVLLDVLNLKEKQLQLPAIKHKYVARLIKHKLELSKLKSTKNLAISKLVDGSNCAVALSKRALLAEAKEHKIVKQIDEEINTQQLIILYLEKVEAIFKNMGFDISNVIKIMQMENQ